MYSRDDREQESVQILVEWVAVIIYYQQSNDNLTIHNSDISIQDQLIND